MVEEGEAGADEAATALVVSTCWLRCPKEPRHLSGAEKKTSGIS